jgi:putative transposase
LRPVEDLPHGQGSDICHETVRIWRSRFGPMSAVEIWKKLPHQKRKARKKRYGEDET